MNTCRACSQKFTELAVYETLCPICANGAAEAKRAAVLANPSAYSAWEYQSALNAVLGTRWRLKNHLSTLETR